MPKSIRQQEASYEALLAIAKLEVDAIEVICEIMDSEKVSRSELARRLGTTPVAITTLLNGSKSPTINRLAEIAHVLGYELRIEAHRVN
jgi:transcriptional regulator with XRE-family HTH domain